MRKKNIFSPDFCNFFAIYDQFNITFLAQKNQFLIQALAIPIVIINHNILPVMPS